MRQIKFKTLSQNSSDVKISDVFVGHSHNHDLLTPITNLKWSYGGNMLVFNEPGIIYDFTYIFEKYDIQSGHVEMADVICNISEDGDITIYKSPIFKKYVTSDHSDFVKPYLKTLGIGDDWVKRRNDTELHEDVIDL